ncbi:hypothetical protein EDEG_03660 [Edhazardia aedis USNM 41457]|uniref:Phospholipid/glycerol acyltransferase domain-containing protein n=1 Tax=Edhazardia aedis (strain USNM 41457) TaxID=1003232 RepID=J9D1X2_EDHAE|nr:hypothetical protein EDEG_03660 [Edhazardia aedis USNM 41457]|eukprot:EJW01861.1 hypothetical protein EDEG_03660 [Edhazardia aedis USNM 41457]
MNEKSRKSTFVRYFYVFLLLLATVLCSFYLILMTPFMIKKSWGIKIVSVVSYILWSIFGKIFRMTFDFEIENADVLKKIKNKESVYVVSNHLGSIDFMIINELSKRKGMLKDAKYMIKQSVAYIPILGYIKFLGFVLLKRCFIADKENIINQMKYFRKNKTPIWFVIYPEGSRFTQEKYELAKKFCTERNLHLYKNILYPRSKGFQITLDEFRDSHIKNLLDISVFYHDYQNNNNTVPSLFRFLFGRPTGKFIVKLKVIEISKIRDNERFLLDLFREKDDFIQKCKHKFGFLKSSSKNSSFIK